MSITCIFFFVHLFFFKLSPYFVYRGWVHLLRFSIKFQLLQSSREKTIFLKSILATFLHCKFKTRGSKKNIPNVFNHLSNENVIWKEFLNYLTTFYLKCEFYKKKVEKGLHPWVFWFLFRVFFDSLPNLPMILFIMCSSPDGGSIIFGKALTVV